MFMGIFKVTKNRISAFNFEVQDWVSLKVAKNYFKNAKIEEKTEFFDFFNFHRKSIFPDFHHFS